MRERMLDDMRDQMKVKDDPEWKAISPLIEKLNEPASGLLHLFNLINPLTYLIPLSPSSSALA